MEGKISIIVYSKRNLELNFFMKDFAKKKDVNVIISESYAELLNTIISSNINYLIIDAKSTKICSEMVNVFRIDGPLLVNYCVLINDGQIDSNLISVSITQLSINAFFREISARYEQTKYVTRNNLRANVDDEKLNSILVNYCLESKYIGYSYIKDCVKLIVNNSFRFRSLNKYIYPLIASKYNTTVACVERNIRGAIKHAAEIAKISNKTSSIGLYNKSNKDVISYIINNFKVYKEM